MPPTKAILPLVTRRAKSTSRPHGFNPFATPGRSFTSGPISPRKIDDSSWASAAHKPSMGGASFAHLISELSATKPGMEALRQKGETMDEGDRARARRVAVWVVGLPVVFGVGVVGWKGVQRLRGENE